MKHTSFKRLLALLREIRKNPKVKHLYINSGMRLDLANQQKELFREIIRNHVSGHMKVAPEHLNDEVLKLMRKNPSKDFYVFKKFFEVEVHVSVPLSSISTHLRFSLESGCKITALQHIYQILFALFSSENGIFPLSR